MTEGAAPQTFDADVAFREGLPGLLAGLTAAPDHLAGGGPAADHSTTGPPTDTV
nr:hypothetical protein [Micromonospora sp. DSM 115978]